MIKIITLAALLLVLAACNEKNSSNDKNANDITSKAKEVVGRKNFGTKFPSYDSATMYHDCNL